MNDSDTLTAQKDAAYHERNQLVALLAALWPSSLERHPDSDTTWEDDWRWIVFIDTPAGQMSWHIHDSELPLFRHVPRGKGVVWDGHTTEEKYWRVRMLSAIETIEREVAQELTIQEQAFEEIAIEVKQSYKSGDGISLNKIETLLAGRVECPQCFSQQVTVAGGLLHSFVTGDLVYNNTLHLECGNCNYAWSINWQENR